MQQFKIKKDGFKEIRKQLLIRMILFMLIIFPASIIINEMNNYAEEPDVNAILITFLFVVVIFIYSMYIALKKQRRLFESYTLTVTDNLITREQMDTPLISMYINDIREIVRNKNGSYSINGNDKKEQIGVPKQIENIAELEEILARIMPIVSKRPASLLERYLIIGVLVLVCMMGVAFTTTNKIISAITGTILVCIMLWSLIETQKSKHIDTKTKRLSWIILVVIASTIGRTLIIIFDIQKN